MEVFIEGGAFLAGVCHGWQESTATSQTRKYTGENAFVNVMTTGFENHLPCVSGRTGASFLTCIATCCLRAQHVVIDCDVLPWSGNSCPDVAAYRPLDSVLGWMDIANPSRAVGAMTPGSVTHGVAVGRSCV
ncbi:hypothetical protein [Corallococcus exercitus]|uniref:Uncharacterized protein n=1 Tax=Corallococcus exercitus TaxID=2316736 RepID=A0A7Y4NSF2_9BACT|nr:hypothetical protein [Corallococcus exercitus]NOK35484.1 hypothetical protein [Corallococcus exercitus]